MSTDVPLLELRDVSLGRGGTEIFDEVRFSIRESEIVGLVVRGSGRTSLLQVAAGLMECTRGVVLFRGRPVEASSRVGEIGGEQHAGFVFQNGGLLVNLSVHDNIALPLRFHTSMTDAEVDARVTEELAAVGMLEVAPRFPFQISRDRQRLVALARAMVRTPEIVFIDECFRGADEDAWLRLDQAIGNARATHSTAFLLMLEGPETVPACVDRLITIEQGRVVSDARVRARGVVA